MKRKTNIIPIPIAALAAFTLSAGSALAQNEFTTSANLGTNNDTWTAADNWSGTDFPKDEDAAVIKTGLNALANSTAVETYSGGLTIEEDATLQIGSGGSTENRTQSALALGTGPITVKDGTTLVWEMKVSPTLPALTLDGDFTIRQQSTESHNRHFTFGGGIEGPGQLTFLGVNNGNHVFNTASPDWSGGFVAGVFQNNNTRFNANAAGVFGTGDVTIGFGADLVIGGAGDAIDDGATLNIDGAGRGNAATKLIMNGSDTVGFLVRDGNPYPAGTYGRIGLGGVDTELSWISGNGILTVADEPDDSTAPMLTGITDPVSGITTDFYTGSSITYTLTFDELVTTAATPTPADFENVGTASVTIDSVTQPGTDPVNEIWVTVTATGTGTLQLGVKDSALFEDLFGNTLSGPFTDDVIFNVLTGPPPSLTINGGDWHTGSNWDSGFPPFSDYPAIVASGVTALANNTAVETYSGGLTIEEDATLQIGAGGNTENRTQSALALGTGPITMEAGSKIQWQMKVSPTPPSITLNGDASIVQASNESHNRNFTFANGISGPGQLTFLGVNNGSHNFTAANPDWSGGFVAGVSANTRTRFNANAAGCFGTGDVTIGAFTDLVIGNAGDAIDDGATLNINGAGRDQSPTTKLIMNGSDTVNLLFVDDVGQAAGTYGRIGLGGVDFNVDWIGSGNGTLTVLSGPGTPTSPYDTWASTNAPTGTPADDFDGDGVSNAIEFVLGGLATTNDLDKLPVVAEDGTDMTFTFVRDQDSVDASVSVEIEVGTDLVNWPDAFTVGADTASSSAGVTVTDNADGTDTIVLTVTKAPDTKKFARLKVEITTP